MSKWIQAGLIGELIEIPKWIESFKQSSFGFRAPRFPSLPPSPTPLPLPPPFPFSKRPIVGLFPQHNHRSIMKPVIYPRNDHENHFNREGRGVHGVVLFPSCCHVKLPNEFPSAYRATSYRPPPFFFPLLFPLANNANRTWARWW